MQTVAVENHMSHHVEIPQHTSSQCDTRCQQQDLISPTLRMRVLVYRNSCAVVVTDTALSSAVGAFVLPNPYQSPPRDCDCDCDCDIESVCGTYAIDAVLVSMPIACSLTYKARLFAPQ
jgi:hypothetical protein